jgi:hypothetical protein
MATKKKSLISLLRRQALAHGCALPRNESKKHLNPLYFFFQKADR